MNTHFGIQTLVFFFSPPRLAVAKLLSAELFRLLTPGCSPTTSRSLIFQIASPDYNFSLSVPHFVNERLQPTFFIFHLPTFFSIPQQLQPPMLSFTMVSCFDFLCDVILSFLPSQN